MRITFVYYDATQKSGNTYMVGISTIASVLKEANHHVDLLHITEDISEFEFKELILKYNTDIYAFTSISLVYPKIKQFSQWLKEKFPTKFRVIGGVHAILNPEDCINDFEAVCLGEGEFCMLELADRMSKGENFYDTKNFWFKNGDKVIKNERLPLVEDLDMIPFPDRDMWDYYNLTDYKNAKQITIMASRGCPYNCTYCFNHKIKNQYPNPHKWVRFRSVNHVIKEIRNTLEKYIGDYQVIRFVDDTIVQNDEWFKEFCQEFKKLRKETGLNISCQARPNEITKENIKLLSEIGTIRLEMGIEAGNEYIRNKVMKRYISDKQILKAFNIANRYGIVTTSFNIMGMPFETLPMMLDTIKINVLAKSSWQNSFCFQPFPNTEAWEVCKEHGFLTDTVYTSLFETSPINCPSFKPYEAKFIQLYFRKLVKLYRWRIWGVWDFLMLHVLPYRMLIKMENIINFTDYLNNNYPKVFNVLRKMRFWK